MVMRQRAVPGNGYNPSSDPKTWDWNPVAERAKLRRNQLPRKCNDVFWAIALVIALCAYIGFAVYGCMNIDWKTEMSEEESAKTKMTIWKIVGQVSIASVFGVVFALMWSCILRACAGGMIKLSIFVFIGFKIAGIVLAFISGNWIIAVILGVALLFHLIYIACIWKRIPMAEATLSIASKVVHRYSCVFWISMLFSIMTGVYFMVIVFGMYGMRVMTHGKDHVYPTKDERGVGDYLMGCLHLLVYLWGTITISYIVHAVCAGVMGTWYFGTSRKRTVTDAVVRALTVNLGSLSFAAFLVALIKVLEKMAQDAMDDAAEKKNILVIILACIAVCVLRMLGDMLNYFNSLAIVRVAVYGENFCTAAKRTMNMIKYRGMDQIINDDLSGLPIWFGQVIIYMVTVPCLFASVKFAMPGLIILSDTSSDIWMWSFIFGIVSLFIPMSILGVIPSFVQSLYVLWGDDPAAFDEVHPQEASQLKAAAYECLGYRVVYDDARITGRA